MQYRPGDKLDEDPYGFLRTDVSEQHSIETFSALTILILIYKLINS